MQPASSGEVAILPVEAGHDLVRVRQAVRALAVACGLSLVDQTKLVTAASELARNALAHGGGGEAVLEQVENGTRSGVRIQLRDRGPGISDPERALTDGYSTGTGLGLGLSGARRLVDEFELDTEAGRGTRVTIVKWRR